MYFSMNFVIELILDFISKKLFFIELQLKFIVPLNIWSFGAKILTTKFNKERSFYNEYTTNTRSFQVEKFFKK